MYAARQIARAERSRGGAEHGAVAVVLWERALELSDGVKGRRGSYVVAVGGLSGCC